MIQKFSCPSCAAELVFHSMHSVYVTCKSCRSVVVRHGTDLEAIGEVSDLMDDLTVLQPRTKGRFDGRAFDILGRARIAWESGFWNEWAVESDGKTCWLSEAQGFFVFYNKFERVSSDLALPKFPGEWYGAPNGESYQVTDIKKAKVIGVEGEIPGFIELNKEYISIDLQKNEKEHATLEVKKDETYFAYGNLREFSEFSFEYLRQLDGW